MYFKSREAAGMLLASQIAKRHTQGDCAVLALSDGGVVVGMQIAMRLRSVITMLVTENIDLPREHRPIGGITADGSFQFNNEYSQGELDEMVANYHTYIEQEKMRRINIMHRESAAGELIRRDLLEDRNVIIVSDGLYDGFGLDLAAEFLKPIRTKKLIVATPLSSVPAVDRMHILADEIYCLDVLENFMHIDHYYDDDDVPAHEAIVQTIDRVIRNWHPPKNTPLRQDTA